MSSSPSRRWLRRLLAGDRATLLGLAAPIGAVGVASAAPAALASAQLGGATGTAGTGTGTGSEVRIRRHRIGRDGSGGGQTGGGQTGGGQAGGGAGGAAQQQADAIAEQPAPSGRRRSAPRPSAKPRRPRPRPRRRQPRPPEAEEKRLKEEERARKAAEQAAQQRAQARATWDKRGRPNKLIIVRQNNVDTITGGQLNNRTLLGPPQPGGPEPDRAELVPLDRGRHRQAQRRRRAHHGCRLRHQRREDAATGGGNSPRQGVLPLHGQRPMTIKGVTVTSVGDDGQPLAANAPGRPYIVVAARGRFDASDSTLSDLGVQPIGADKGEPGISYNTDSTGALVRTSVLRSTTGVELSASRNVRLDGDDRRVVVGRPGPAGGQGHAVLGGLGRAQRRQRRPGRRPEHGPCDHGDHHVRQPLVRHRQPLRTSW